MIEGTRAGTSEPDDGFVQFHAAGERAKGEFRCSQCGYGVAILTVLPTCPMCSGSAWERSDWRPFVRALDEARPH